MIAVILSFVAAASIVFGNVVLHGDRVHDFWLWFIAGDACAGLGLVIAAAGPLLFRGRRSWVDVVIGAAPNVIVLAGSGLDLLLLYGVASPH